MIPVNVVTGFLGSGKTTLLREVLASPRFSDTAVIVNEFGEVGLDHLLLEEVEEGVLLLESGCICCTIRSDLKETIRSLHDKAARGDIPRFARVVVETTGLADPAPILSTIAADPIIRNHYRIANLICTIDALNGARTIAAHDEAGKQIAVADRLLITKVDLAETDSVETLKRQLARLNPAAPVATSSGSGFDADFLFGADVGDELRRAAEVQRWIASAEALEREREVPSHEHAGTHTHHHGAHGGSHGGLHGDADTNAFVLRFPEPIDWTAFGIWLTALLHAHGERILRVKGILQVAESQTPVVLHGVQHVVHPPMHLDHWPDEDHSSKIVFITRGIDEQRVRRSLNAFLAKARALGPRSEVA
ncbi:CobW family GTP-binding protein [Pseudohoeflea coraliihabitans]|uniref:GTP-binding protein n=1 Tax=Pseudohoeflea coraliihabitans TaxID=2860393 RepID=A0ABS6WPC9_9HYPH|nr:GTP-binding protein [Pseudohoeflea sp. DP4N28-3]